VGGQRSQVSKKRSHASPVQGQTVCAKRSKIFHHRSRTYPVNFENWFVGLLCCSTFLESAYLGKGIKSISVVGVPPPHTHTTDSLTSNAVAEGILTWALNEREHGVGTGTCKQNNLQTHLPVDQTQNPLNDSPMSYPRAPCPLILKV
jgi:hypothetical protein